MSTVGRFLLRHRRLLGLAHRWPIHRGDAACFICRAVWTHLESLPGFTDGLRRAEAELEAGGGFRYDLNSEGWR